MSTTIRNETVINRPIEAVYDYVTTPGNWPAWHPSSLSVSGNGDHSLEVGESVTEKFRVAGRVGEVVWTVSQREPPHRWVIEGQIVGRQDGGTVAYTLAPGENGVTHFTRAFSYPTPGLWFSLLNALLLRRRIAAESATAVRQLKSVLEDARR